jgi:hypothetical protein
MMWAISQLNGYCIMCDGSSTYIKDNFINREVNFCWNTFMNKTNKDGTPTFFLYTPEIMLSFLNDVADKSINTEYYNYIKDGCYNCSYHKIRNDVYKKYWTWEERKVYNGFEKIIDEDQRHRKILKKKHAGGDSYYPIKINDLRQMLGVQ